MSEIEKFRQECAENIRDQGNDEQLVTQSIDWLNSVGKYKYAYNFSWLGRPIIQFPQDMVAIQEIIWDTKPDLVIETGIAHGGSLIFTASILELIGGSGEVLGIDLDIREHNKKEIESHALFNRIQMVEGSSIDEKTTDLVYNIAKSKSRVIVILDSNHTHDHVLKELELYSSLVKKGGYIIVMDTAIEDAPLNSFPDRPWSKGNNPKTAVWEFLKSNKRFQIDANIQSKLLVTVAPDGYLKCIDD